MSHDPRDDEVSRLRVPPHSVEAEQSVLGSLLNDNDAFDAVCGEVDEADFYAHDHRLIFAAIKAQVLACKPADVVTVFEGLKREKGADGIGLEYLNALAQSVPGAANAKRYAEIVRERATLRRIIAAADEIATQAFGATKAAEVLDALAAKASQLERRQPTQRPITLQQTTVAAMDLINDIVSGNVTPGWPTGFDPLDEMTNGGPGAGKVVVLAARPSVGKSSFAQQLGLHYAACGKPTLMLSQEMPSTELSFRALANLGAVNYGRLQQGKLSDAEWSRLVGAVEKTRELPYHVDDQPGLTLADIRAKARAVPGLKVLIVDYLQLSASSGQKGRTRNDEIEELTRGLKTLAKQMGLLLIELSQLNREVEKRMGKEPEMSDLRDSGGIEQDADLVLFLWPLRELANGAKLVGCKAGKNRSGTLGRFPLEFRGWVQQWSASEEPMQGPSYRRDKAPEEAFE
jgi:replicative DNA helicase